MLKLLKLVFQCLLCTNCISFFNPWVNFIQQVITSKIDHTQIISTIALSITPNWKYILLISIDNDIRTERWLDILKHILMLARKTEVWRQIDSEAGFMKSMHVSPHVSTCVGALMCSASETRGSHQLHHFFVFSSLTTCRNSGE